MSKCPCGAPLPVAGRGRIPSYCSSSCRGKAHRARRQGASFPVPEPIPPALRELPRWTRRDGKRPVRVGGAPASSTDPGTWASFADVQRGAGDGFGIMLGGGLGCYDFDHCLDEGGRLVSGRVAEVLTRLEPIHTEVSMSGRGLHVFVAMAEGPGTRLPWMETYSRARFIAVTGTRWEG